MENINFTEEQVKAAFEAAYASADEVIGNTDFLSRLEKESVARAAFMSVKYALLNIGTNDYCEMHRRFNDSLNDYLRIKGGERNE